MSQPSLDRLPGQARFWPLPVLALIAAAAVIGVLVATGGHPTYLLDDTWIHLQFSEQLARGHFGLVPGEKASPSSSILYPLLLTPLAGTALHQWLPAVWNAAALVGVLLLWQRLFSQFVFDDLSPQQRALASGLLALALIVVTNTLWLALTGMEHALQVAASLAVIVGLIELLVQSRARWWLLAGLIAGPLLRLENFSITLPAAACLLWFGHWRIAVLALAGSIGGVVIHGLVSQAADMPFFGGPVLLKGWLDDLAQSPEESLRWHLLVLARTLRAGRPDSGVLVISALLTIGAVWHWRRRDRVPTAIALIAIAALGAQFLFGSFRAGRYEIYAQCFGLAALCYVARAPIQIAIGRLGAVVGVFLAALLTAALFPANLIWTATAPWAAQDIWRQHWQMRRFAIDYIKAPVAVNDIGLVAYRNPFMVLDLVGLGSEEVRLARIENRADGAFYSALFARHKIEAVLVYDHWFGRSLPAHLQRVAEFQLGRDPAIAGGPVVAVYGTSSEAAARVRQAAIAFAPSMPPGSWLVVIPPP